MIRKLSIVFSLFLAIGIFAPVGMAQTTGFTYQGSLKSGGIDASGNHDFEFALFDALGGGAQLGATITQSSVSVTNGIFAVSLDFGSQFPGAGRFLEIRVRPTGGGAFTPLTPRQPITSAPYSVKSLNSDTAATATNATNATNATTAVNFSGSLSGDVTGTQSTTAIATGAVTTPRLADNSVTNAKIVDVAGSKITGLIATATIPGANVTGAVANATNAVNATNATTATNATQLNGQSAPFYQNATNINAGTLEAAHLPLPLTLSGTSGTHILRGENASTTANSSGVYGLATASTGLTYGGRFENSSAFGTGVFGSVTAATSNVNYGVFGNSNSTNGIGVYGQSTGTGVKGSGSVGVYGESASDGTGVRGFTGGGIGVEAQTVTGLALRSQGTSWFSGDTTPTLTSSLTGGNVAGIAIGSVPGIGYIFAYNYGASAPRPLSINQHGGSVGIGIAQPLRTLHVNGTARIGNIPPEASVATVCFNALGDLLNCNASSLRFKDNVQTYSEGLNLIRQLRPISYNWKDGGAYDIGLGAEDVAMVAPFFASRDKDGVVEGVRYERLNMVLINAINQQQEQIERQQQQIDALTKLVCESKRRSSLCWPRQ